MKPREYFRPSKLDPAIFLELANIARQRDSKSNSIDSYVFVVMADLTKHMDDARKAQVWADVWAYRKKHSKPTTVILGKDRFTYEAI
jgi:hypothetical protein